jgi:hypothetical protein
MWRHCHWHAWSESIDWSTWHAQYITRNIPSFRSVQNTDTISHYEYKDRMTSAIVPCGNTIRRWRRSCACKSCTADGLLNWGHRLVQYAWPAQRVCTGLVHEETPSCLPDKPRYTTMANRSTVTHCIASLRQSTNQSTWCRLRAHTHTLDTYQYTRLCSAFVCLRSAAMLRISAEHN